jgi:acetylcholinesterase/cholinesterase
MQVKSLSLTVLTILVIFIINVTQSECNDISVRIKNGIINGKVEVFDGKEVNVFLGIPYAEPPIGDLRFRKPLPVKEWTEPIDATKWSNPCLQISRDNRAFLNTNFSEDCLHLNIWSPVISKSNDELKAVLFYIHGGALIFGSANQPFHDSTVLSIKGDVVVVTINYR